MCIRDSMGNTKTYTEMELSINWDTSMNTLFEIEVSDTPSFIFACIAIAGLSILAKYIDFKINQFQQSSLAEHLKNQGKDEKQDEDEDITQVKHHLIANVLNGFMYFTNTILKILIMLTSMTMNAWIIIAQALGYTLGFLIFKHGGHQSKGYQKLEMK
eukprot:TRINITY_DN21573_c0_g1_i2.p2 TRINITY_DN21573_c0_g1~~TRINITY_DN21573_c0_g1_i2.p2  ORF type:complete len:158 (+),score=15.21 TRINITY_DN21573_c0_g1_i2:108-581(+)